MDTLLEFNRWLHIIVGFVGLAAFWIPVFAKKGGPLHRSAGKVFRWSAIVVLSAAAVSVTGHLGGALLSGTRFVDHPEAFAFLLFLGYLAMVTGLMLSHGIGVLRHKRDLTELNTPYRRLSAWAAIVASALIVAWALYWQPGNMILLLALSPLGVLNGVHVLQVISGRRREPGLWRIEHLNAMFGVGIAFHTAFTVFGMNRLTGYTLPGWWQVVPWILPTVIGIPAGLIWTRRERHRLAPAGP
ncbi:MAG: hypothetical protein Kow0020_16260 [Wenzhouxiangellaceae bacterium]